MTDAAGSASPRKPALIEDKKAEPRPRFLKTGRPGMFGAHWSFDLLLWFAVAAGLWLVVYDAVLFHSGNFDLFESMLSAESEAVLAVVATVGGLAAAWKFLQVTPVEPPHLDDQSAEVLELSPKSTK
jgi:hypothetical protein